MKWILLSKPNRSRTVARVADAVRAVDAGKAEVAVVNSSRAVLKGQPLSLPANRRDVMAKASPPEKGSAVAVRVNRRQDSNLEARP